MLIAVPRYQHHPFCQEQGDEGIIDLPKFINLFNQVTDMLAKESAVNSFIRTGIGVRCVARVFACWD